MRRHKPTFVKADAEVESRSNSNSTLASLYVINRNLWAFAALPLIFAAGQVKIKVPRGRLGFYAYYPAHQAVLWGLVRLA